MSRYTLGAEVPEEVQQFGDEVSHAQRSLGNLRTPYDQWPQTIVGLYPGGLAATGLRYIGLTLAPTRRWDGTPLLGCPLWAVSLLNAIPWASGPFPTLYDPGCGGHVHAGVLPAARVVAAVHRDRGWSEEARELLAVALLLAEDAP